MAGRLRLLLALLLLAGSGLVPNATAAAETIRTFGKVFGTQTNGAIRITGNALETCDTGVAACRSALAGSATGASNNEWAMRLLDADADAGTKSSSAAKVSLPDGAKVLYAGLFWGASRAAGTGGTASTGDGKTIKLRLPNKTEYQTLTAGRTDYLSAQTQDYSSYLDVTTLVQEAGPGEYWGADIAAGTGADRYAGWSLVIAYEDADEPLRDLSVFNGYARVTTGDVIKTSISGFLAPPSGPVNARFGSVTYEGDAGISGDYFAVNGTRLADAQSPSANFFGSRVTDAGANLTDRTPAALNNLGLDAKVVDAAGILANSATTAELTFASTGDFYYPAALTTQIDLYAPTIKGTKTVRNLAGNDPAKVGDTLEYTLSYGNTGEDDALDSIVRDDLPPNTTYVPGSLAIGTAGKTDQAGDDQAEYDETARSVRFRVGTGANANKGGRLRTNDTTTVRFRVTLDAASAGTTVVNTGYLDYTAATLKKPYTYRAEEVRTPVAESADLVLTKTGTPDPVPAGAELTYKLVAHNNGPSVAQNVAVTDTLPDGVTLVSATSTQGACTSSPGKVDCAIGEVASGAEATITVVVRVPATTALTNVATVTSTTSDPNPGNNSATVTTPVTRSADLQLQKAVAPTGPAPGEKVKYTLTIRNNGPSDAEQVRIADSLPAGLTILDVQVPAPAVCSAAGQDVSCVVDRLAGKATLVVQVTAVLDSAYQGGPLTNTAAVSSATPDPDPSNNTGTATVTPAAPKADLVVGKQTMTSPVVPGQPVTYQISVRNDGPSDALAVEVADDLPAALIDASANTTAGSCTVSAGQVRCELGDLGAGSAATITVLATVSVTATGSLVNAATATSSTPDPEPGNNTGRTTDELSPSADLAIAKTAQPVPVQAGRPVTYTLTTTNNGPSAARSVTVTDPVPAPLVYVSAATSAGSCEQADGTVSCAIGTIAPGDVVTVTVVANVPSGTPPNKLDNTAKVASPTPDPVTENNTATYTLLTGAQANITLTKTARPDPVVAGEQLTYVLTVRNAGPSDAQGVTVEDDVPAALNGVNAAATGGATCTLDGNQVRCSADTLAAGAEFGVTITGTVAPATAPGKLINTATAGSRTPEDPTESDNTSTTTTEVVAGADLSIAKSAPAIVVAGNELTYTLTVRNDGPSDAVGAVVTDTLPPGTAYVRGSSSAGDCLQDPSTAEPVVICPGGRLKPGGELMITVVVRVGPAVTGKLTNTATATSQTPDPDDSNNRDTADTTVTASADLSITKAVKPSPLIAGGEGLYTLTVHNNGPSTATAVTVTDQLPSGLSVLSATSAEGTCTTAVSCDLGSMGPGSDAVIQIRVRVDAGQTAALTNAATVTSPTPDPNEPDNTSTITTEVEQSADLEVIKTSDEQSATAGGGVTYRITVANHGPSDATAVTFTDTLPAGLTLIGVQPDCPQLICSLGTIKAGESAKVVVTAALDPAYAGKSLANTASAKSPVPDPDPANNSSTVTIPVGTSADLQLVKQSEPAAVTPGSTFDYTLQLTNAGPSVARSVVVTDTLPAGLTVVSTQAPCQADGSVVRCAVGDVPIGQLILSLRVRLAAGYDGQTLTNTATATSPTSDPDKDNNTGKIVSPVTALADLAIAKTMTPANPIAGGKVTYALTIKNNGPSDAQQVAVTDELPRGLTMVVAKGCVVLPPATPGSPDAPEAGTVQCSVKSLANGDSLVVTIVATVVPGFNGLLENRARVGSATPDPVTGNNEATVTGKIGRGANLAVRKAAATDSVVAGSGLTYRIEVYNAGPSAALDVTVTDVLAAGLRLRKADGCSVEGQRVTCPVGRLDPGQTAVGTIEVTVDAAYGGKSVTNRVTATSSTPDPDPSDNSSSVTVDVKPKPGKPDGELPETGAPVGLAGVIAAFALLAAGVLLIVVSRRGDRHSR
ncbi:DUF11 domain-containing protein [Kribbella sandramycini]|uniref:DUF11 domain-containing protein n=1 Tax=Kribbella sandramycini TaxID=60450 RepID=A0A7Y4L571_9ACTN|nr:DUF11 domain-containing protein [Kribbella sandramycini]MBB6566853.1 putative repeat protein (TIGR01451 family) [Kribbella sandramycini]NOL44575.1 DUF11 domain-containing protein [Kribbella sandramycini]